jgi:MoaA/NifB/PqqE/SkfB family radical SAM enzyme
VYLIALTGAGEAMVHPDFWQIVEILSNNLPNVQFKMNSSGVTLKKAAERLVQYPFRNITISLNAATPETYERFIGGNFEQVLAGIKALVAARARSASGDSLRLTLSMVLMNSTISELPDFVSKAFELGVEEVQGIYLMINEGRLAAESPWHQPQRSNEFLTLSAERAARLGVATRLPPRFNEQVSAASLFQPSSLPESQGQACVEPWSTTYIRPNGDVISCPYSEMPLGNICESDFDEIWHGALYGGLRDSLDRKEYWGMCRSCCGFNETGRVDDYLSHWLGERRPADDTLRSLPILKS